MLHLPAQHKALVAAGALLLLAVAIGGLIGLVLVLPPPGMLMAAVGGQDPGAVLADLPRLLTSLLGDMPKAVREYLAPLLQLTSALAGKA